MSHVPPEVLCSLAHNMSLIIWDQHSDAKIWCRSIHGSCRRGKGTRQNRQRPPVPDAAQGAALEVQADCGRIRSW